ncbi:related to HFM1 - DNA/RNA helicase [Ustilago sp. UG-2017a]|nr:related to HFM1 - DNA/RNA helicase [Ustilago sp. UG-2017a]
MANQYSFENLEQQYELNEYRYGDAVVADLRGYTGSTQYGDPHAQGIQANALAMPFWQTFPPPTDQEQDISPEDVAFIRHNFDFERAQAAGLLAGSPPVPPVPALPIYLPASHLGQGIPNIEQWSRNIEAGPTHPFQARRPQPSRRESQEFYAEPEAGNRIRLVFETSENVVLSAPTGSGKTVVFELALIRMLTREAESARAVYLAPTKALCAERTRDWSARFGPVGCSVTELTGDSVHGLHVARKSRLIVTTPEKWDSLTRKWDEQSGILSTIRLVLIDEVHILNEAQRGARLEVVVTRIKNRGHHVRFVAVSATVPNLADVAAWIGSNKHTRPAAAAVPLKDSPPAEMFQFGEAYRPCQLEKHVYSYPKAKDEFAFQAYLNHKLLELIETHAAGRPCLIFCATRRSTVQAANTIVEACKKARENGGRAPSLTGGGHRSLEATTFDDEDLQKLASSGVAFHHAGLSAGDRRTVERAFLSDKIAVLCCTTTLATGINLPAYCVIIRGTKQYDGHWCEMSELDLIQMMGRAGRPQFDRSGVSVIMCEDTVQAHYRELVSGSRDIESSLAPDLVEHVNAEVGLRGRTTEAQIKDWIRQSFMWTRLQKNPTYYLSKDEGIGLDSVEEILQHLCTKTLVALQVASLISCPEDSAEIISTEYGDIMSRFFLRYKTMLAIMSMPDNSNTKAVLEAVAEAEEFGEQRMRQGEKGFLASLRTHVEIRFPPRQVARVADKVSLLIQAHLAAINLSQLTKSAGGDVNPTGDIRRIIPHATRIVKAAVDVAIYRRDGTACKASLDLARSIAAGAWDGSPAMLRQIDQIGERSVKSLANAGITTWQSLASTTPARVEMILGRNPPFGSKVINAARSVPRIGLEVMQRSSAPLTSTRSLVVPGGDGQSSSDCVQPSPIGMKIVLDVTVRVENRATCMLKSKVSKMALSVCILTLTSDSGYVDFRRMPIWRFDREKHFTLHVQLEDPLMRILTFAACDEIAGTMMQASLIPVDMASGSHRTRIARVEHREGGMGDFDAAPSMHGDDPSTRQHLHGNADTLLMRETNNDSASPKRCKHKCKSDCRHVCCQRAREQEASDKPREYRFQSRVLDNDMQSLEAYRNEPFAMPTSASSLISQKRKASETIIEDYDGPQDLLSQLDRLTAAEESTAGTILPLQVPEHSGGGFMGGERASKDASATESRGRIRALDDELGRDASYSQHLTQEATRTSLLGGHQWRQASGTRSALADKPHERPQPCPTVTNERPPQRRFLKSLDPPSWRTDSDVPN